MNPSVPKAYKRQIVNTNGHLRAKNLCAECTQMRKIQTIRQVKQTTDERRSRLPD